MSNPTPVQNLFQELPPAVLEELMNSFQIQQVTKGEHLLVEGQVCRHMYLVKSGAIRHYRITKIGNEMSTWFSFEGDVVSDMYSFVKQMPSEAALVAIEPCVLMTLHISQIDNLRRKHHSFETFSRKLIEDYMIFTERRSFSMQENDAAGRYHELIVMNPKVEQRVSQTHIASYLGIKKETLSRLKKKMARTLC